MRLEMGVMVYGKRYRVLVESADIDTHSFMSDHPEVHRLSLEMARQAFEKCLRGDEVDSTPAISRA